MRLIDIKDVTKVYRGKKVLNNVSLQVNQGEVYGFIGENGAGKTTFIRYLLGLIPDVNGRFVSHEVMSVANKEIGVLVERPVLFDHLSAFDNLKYQQILFDCVDENYILECLDMVGLSHAYRQKAGSFSLGMKQRLGIAKALVTKAKLLILDEPVNGLDPSGMHAIRDLLLSLNQKHGVTIFMSTHILSELEQTATKYGIIHKGKLVKETSPEGIVQQSQKFLNLSFKNNQEAFAKLQGLDMGFQVNKGKGGSIDIVFEQDIDFLKVFDVIKQLQLELESFNTVTNNLEDYFISIIKGEQV